MIVFDSSTLILLAKTEILDLFISNFKGRILIPEKVKWEVIGEGEKEAPVISICIEKRKIEVKKVKNPRYGKKMVEDFNIDIGEAEAIMLAIQEGASLIATDDKNAIRACKMLNLDFVTAISILIRTFQKGLLDQDETLLKLEKLQSIGRYSRPIIEDAVRQVKGGV
jgi:predicted nucleic acid-binding protein